MKFYFYIFITTLLFMGCENSNSSQEDYAYFGGEIINPSNNYITFNNTIGSKDTVYLDKNNRFVYKVNRLKPGLHVFTHGGEYQTILLEPKDSLMFRLNTNDFDESLVYTGTGSKKNNYLIKSFLNDETDNKKFMNISHLEPEEFQEHMNKLRAKKLAYLDEFLANKPCSKLFENIVKSTIDYNYYAYHEMYPFGYFGNNKLIHFKDLPDGFYDFRKNVNLNDESLSEIYAYNRFLFWHFNNIALKQYYKDGSHQTFDRMAVDYNLEKLELIDSTITSEKIKNYLLKHTIRDFVLNTDDIEDINTALDVYLKKSTDSKDKEYLKKLVESAEKLRPGNVLPDANLVDFEGNSSTLSSIIKKPTVIYCWSTNYKMHSRNSHYKINELKLKYPNVNFISINFNDNDLHYWKKTVRSLNYASKNEYKFFNPSEAMENYVITFNHKVFVVDDKMKIINSNIGLFDKEMGKCLEKLSSQKTYSIQ